MPRELCQVCGHPWDPHVLVADKFRNVGKVTDVPVGGVISCPVEECGCQMTWGLSRTYRGYEH